MHWIILTGLFIFFLQLQTLAAHAWNDTGHRLVALVAWEQLDQSTRDSTVAMFKKHPRFSQDFSGEMPNSIKKANEFTQNKWIFAHAATWPAIARRFDSEARKTYHHATWHFIRLPVFLSPLDEMHFRKNEKDPQKGYMLPVDLDMVWKPGMRLNSLNIIQAFQRSTAQMTKTHLSQMDKALELCWIFHLVGDIHQPAHSTALFSEKGLPSGDRGGNKIKLKSIGNLHAFWDQAAGTETELFGLGIKAKQWVKDPTLSKLGESSSQNMQHTEWVEESHTVAAEIVYAQEIIKEIRRQEAQLQGEETLEEGTQNISVSNEYKKIVKAKAQDRVVQAGYRLAELIKEVIPD